MGTAVHKNLIAFGNDVLHGHHHQSTLEEQIAKRDLKKDFFFRGTVAGAGDTGWVFGPPLPTAGWPAEAFVLGVAFAGAPAPSFEGCRSLVLVVVFVRGCWESRLDSLFARFSLADWPASPPPLELLCVGDNGGVACSDLRWSFGAAFGTSLGLAAGFVCPVSCRSASRSWRCWSKAIIQSKTPSSCSPFFTRT